MVRLPTPPEKYSQEDQARLRREIELALSNQVEIPIGGGALREEAGELIFRKPDGTEYTVDLTPA